MIIPFPLQFCDILLFDLPGIYSLKYDAIKEKKNETDDCKKTE